MCLLLICFYSFIFIEKLQAFGLHGHDHEDGHDHGDSHGVNVPPYLYYSIVVLAGIYCFYLFERLMAINHVSIYSICPGLSCSKLR